MLCSIFRSLKTATSSHPLQPCTGSWYLRYRYRCTLKSRMRMYVSSSVICQARDFNVFNKISGFDRDRKQRVTPGADFESAPSGRSSELQPPCFVEAEANADVVNSSQAAAISPPALVGSQRSGPDELSAFEEPNIWQGVERWVIFSDLHYREKSAKVCHEVLQRVHQEAVDRNAGILFLGDFFDHQGAIKVGLLSELYNLFKTWSRPTIMLVGNHDMANYGPGDALSVLGLSPLIRIIQQPTLFMNALWLPYMQDTSAVQAAIDAAGPVQAYLVHADVAGAKRNFGIRNDTGLDPSMFAGSGVSAPVTLSGHFHRPHMVPGTNIRYVGSPYQVRSSEGGQHKALLVYDNKWKYLESISIEYGGRHFSISGREDIPQDLLAGDKVTWKLTELERREINNTKEALEARGIIVELRVKSDRSPVVEDAEALEPVDLWRKYNAEVALDAKVAALGLEYLKKEAGSSEPRLDTNLELWNVEMEGFGPFRDRQQYLLLERGLRAVVGQKSDTDDPRNSNGTGKTMLVMASLWCLTGDTDSRVEGGNGGGLSNRQVINFDSQEATVTVRGMVHGTPFKVQRTVARLGPNTRAETKHLSLDLDSVQRGKGIRGVEKELERVFATKLLQGVVFCGQTEVNSLLEGGKSFENELAKVADAEVWNLVAKAVSADKKAVGKDVTRLQDRLKERQRDIDKLSADSDEWRTIKQSGKLLTVQRNAIMCTKPDLCKLWQHMQFEVGTPKRGGDDPTRGADPGASGEAASQASQPADSRWAREDEALARINVAAALCGLEGQLGAWRNSVRAEPSTTNPLPTEAEVIACVDSIISRVHEAEQAAKAAADLPSCGAAQARAIELQGLIDAAAEKKQQLTDLDKAVTGCIAMLLQGALHTLEANTNAYLDVFAAGTVCRLSPDLVDPTDLAAKGEVGAARFKLSKRLLKKKYLEDGTLEEIEQDMRQLSGGQRRQVALALLLGFMQLARQRSRLKCNVLVLDEVMQHLDSPGRDNLVEIVRSLPQTTKLMVGQLDSFTSETMDYRDVVINKNGTVTDIICSEGQL